MTSTRTPRPRSIARCKADNISRSATRKLSDSELLQELETPAPAEVLYFADPYDQDGEGFYFYSQEEFFIKAEENREHEIKVHPNAYIITNADTNDGVDFSTIPASI